MVKQSQLFDAIAEIARPKDQCLACQGEGFQYEPKDDDGARMRVPCEACGGVALEEARALRDEALGKMDKRPSAKILDEHLALFSKQWDDEGDGGVTFTADDIRTHISREAHKSGVAEFHPNAIGSLFSRASRRGIIQWTERFVQSTHPSNHGRYIKVWATI